jgi:hypothetical protein
MLRKERFASRDEKYKIEERDQTLRGNRKRSSGVPMPLESVWSRPKKTTIAKRQAAFPSTLKAASGVIRRLWREEKKKEDIFLLSSRFASRARVAFFLRR